jgi:mannose-6-phosphate isomerase class I
LGFQFLQDLKYIIGLKMYPLQCAVQNYEWGKKGKESLVGELYSIQTENEISENKRYAELWMGTHINGKIIFKKKDNQK